MKKNVYRLFLLFLPQFWDDASEVIEIKLIFIYNRYTKNKEKNENRKKNL